mgnify:CR=1 FL=1
MARSHYCQVTFAADVKGVYNLDLVGSKTIVAIAAARIARNIGFKAGVAYARKRGVSMSLVRLAMQLEATRKAGL